jgi:hypothetical protein
VHVTDIERLIPLERAAETERAKLAGLVGDEYESQWKAWRAASETVQAAITEHAAESGENRHAEEDPAG